MKKAIVVFLFSLCSILRSFSQQQEPSSIDLIVLLDTSASMSSHYSQVTNYLTGPFLREFLRLGDTFHLISFSASPRTELARRIEGLGDVETILGRITIMYPLERYSDITRALDYTEQYIASLPKGRQKKAVLITDGDHEAAENRINETSARLARLGTGFYLVKFPLTGNGPSSGRTARAGQRAPVQAAPRTEPAAPALPAAASNPGIAVSGSGTPHDQPVPPAGSNDTVSTVTGTADIVSDITPAAPLSTAAGNENETATPPQSGGDSGPVSGGTVTQAKPVPKAPAFPFQPRTRPAGASVKPVGPQVREKAVSSGAAVENPTPPERTETSRTGNSKTTAKSDTAQPGKTQQEKDPNGFPLSIIFFSALALGLLCAAGFGAVRIFRHLHDSPGRAMAYAAGRTVSGPQRIQPQSGLKTVPMISLFVEDQNTNTGRRNIHTLKAGNSYTVGGGKSDFLIFLVSLPPRIGELHFDGQQCTFIPKKPQYFPESGSGAIPNCIGKTIRVLSDNHYQLSFRMERYEDPLKALNRLLNSINVEGVRV